jgi:glutathione S-transferase
VIDNQGRYLVGDRLGLADIAVCSILAPLLVIKGTPWELENDDIEQFTGELKHTTIRFTAWTICTAYLCD